jgi:cell fate regulator YaaT (PSP1 superfamily)
MDEPNIIGIRFQKGGKIYHFDASHYRDIQPHDYVVVETARGRQLGEVIGIVSALKQQEGNIKPIQRKATPRDLVLRQIWQCKEAEAIATCRAKAKDLGLADLKFVGAEFSYDGTRLTLLYNSEEGSEKPDLRSLRRALNRSYPHAQIEMHPMGPRDVAKLLGGMGACGLEERCCTAYLTDFNPISIKMAKEQGISLTPTEITGMCGRLRCCLAYEFEQYTEARKTLPKKNKRVLTPQGEGKVLEVFPLKGAVLVLLENEAIREYPQQEIQLFDENGVPIPKVIVKEEESSEGEELPNQQVEEYDVIETEMSESITPEIGMPPVLTSPPEERTPFRRKAFRGQHSRGGHLFNQNQKPDRRDATNPANPKKPKSRPEQSSGQGQNRQSDRSRPMKGNRPPSQRRERDRE